MKSIPSILVYLFSFALLASCSSSRQATEPNSPASGNNSNQEKQTFPEPEVYRASYSKKNDLVHTRLEVRPDWDKRQLQGKAEISLHPHFYPGDSVELNARGMDLHEIYMLKKGMHLPLAYLYHDDRIHIQLDTTYSKDEVYTIFIDYTAKPEELKLGGSAAIIKDQGLYFVNPDGKNPDLPKQLWTQGETESNSAWFPTIESPNQKMTQEIYITVDTSFQTLSNGLLISSTLNADGTRTDYWKQSLPAPPYLTMIAAGQFAVVKDHWRDLDVTYYLDKPYEKYARMIFGHTPEMMEFFSKKLRLDFPWEKYSQVVVHDYVSGAMENTTAVVHGTNMQQDPREYMDDNCEDYISHELFHHWFGDFVTCESWSNITLNEGFANYAQYLWREYKFGREDADILNRAEQSMYLHANINSDPPLIRFQYVEREDIYDYVSYNKGGRVLHMLRKYVGDDAFFASLHEYLESHKFSTGEIHELRLAFEKITGEDLNWFFNQWFLRGGRPSLNISCVWNEPAGKETITLEQTQDFKQNPLYRLPMDVDFYSGNKIERHRIVMEKAKQDFVFDFSGKPDLVNVDAEKMLLCEKKKENKTNAEMIFQYYHAPLFLDRFEALKQIGNAYHINTPEAKLISDALHDKNWKIRLTALDNIDELVKNNADTLRPVLISIAQTDNKSAVRAAAYKILNKNYRYEDLSAVFDQALHDSSYRVLATVFKIISEKDSLKGAGLAEQLESDSAYDILEELGAYYSTHPSQDKSRFYARALRYTTFWNRYLVLKDFEHYLNGNEISIFENGTEQLFKFGQSSSSTDTRKSIIVSLKVLQSELKYKIQLKEDELEKKKNAISKHPEISSEMEEVKKLNAQSAKLSEQIDLLDKMNSSRLK